MVDQNAFVLLQIGRQFVEVLVELGLTPRARAAILKIAPQQAPSSSGLDELRTRRERRA